jgi:hypothetical protein
MANTMDELGKSQLDQDCADFGTSQGIGTENISRILTLISNQTSDLERWARPLDYSTAGWDYRLPICVEFLKGCESVLDFGCGNKTLREHLSDDCLYQPADIYPRSDDSLILDGNSSDWGSRVPRTYQTITAIGVLEYIYNFANFLRNASSCAKELVMTYHLSDGAKVKHSDAEISSFRAVMGWLSNHSFYELVSEVYKCGGSIEKIHLFPPKKYFQNIVLLVKLNK